MMSENNSQHSKDVRFLLHPSYLLTLITLLTFLNWSLELRFRVCSCAFPRRRREPRAPQPFL